MVVPRCGTDRNLLPRAGEGVNGGISSWRAAEGMELRGAADRAVAWSGEAGHEVDVESLVDVLNSDPDPVAENLFFRLLDRLGVVPL
jgi:hypothetical protein